MSRLTGMLEDLLEGSDPLAAHRVSAALTAGAFLSGRPLLGTGIAGMAVWRTLLADDENEHHHHNYDNNENDNDENDEEGLSPAQKQHAELWKLLSVVSLAAGSGSWCLLVWSTIQSDTAEAYRFWWFGQALPRFWAVALAFVLYQDVFRPSRSRRRSTMVRTSKTTPTTTTTTTRQKTRRKRSRASSLATVLYEIRVRVLEGKSLVAMDTNLFGKRTTSDPYVVVRFGPNGMGKTRVVPKSLDPVWPPNLFRLTVLPKSIEIYKDVELCLFDHDRMSADDPMGLVRVPIPDQPGPPVTGWYQVGRGDGDHYCRNASGLVRVEIQVLSDR